MLKILVCGGRDFTDRELLFRTLDGVLAKIGSEITIVHGAARGADLMAEEWAKSRQIAYMGFPAKWKDQGRAAGQIRNRRMRDEAAPDQCIAFRGGAGTRGMIEIMRGYGVDPWLVNWGYQE